MAVCDCAGGVRPPVGRHCSSVAAPATKSRLLLSDLERLKQKRGYPPTG